MKEKEQSSASPNSDKGEALHIPTTREAIDAVTLYTCQRNCYGVRGQAGICCTIGARDYIIGPIPDAKAFLQRLEKKYNRKFNYDQVFIEHREGKKLFPDKSCWQNPAYYPAMRVKIDAEQTYPCPFLSEDKLCTVNDIKPGICGSYQCDHLKKIVNML
jgi:Fe-S-cluster containining protein